MKVSLFLMLLVGGMSFAQGTQSITITPVTRCDMGPTSEHFDVVASPEVTVVREFYVKNYGAATCELSSITLAPPCEGDTCPISALWVDGDAEIPVAVGDWIPPGGSAMIAFVYAPRTPGEVIEYNVDLQWEKQEVSP